MILLGYNWTEIALGTLYVTLALLIIVIGYRKLLAYLGRGRENKKDYCVLYPLEKSPAAGELEFYFTTERDREIKLMILDADMNEIQLVVEKKVSPGGNIVRFDSAKLPNGNYFFCLKTENQKTMKKMVILNV